MTPLTKNILVVLGLLTVGYAGYYLFTSQATAIINASDENETVYQNMLANTEVFIVRSQELDTMDLDIDVLDDARFRSLHAFTRPIEDQPTGRTNPFAAAESNSFINFGSE
jgi:hypothetical protein